MFAVFDLDWLGRRSCQTQLHREVRMTEPAATPAVPSPASPASEGESLYRYAGIVTVFTLLSRILGMVRDLAISHRFGASGATDAWVQAFRIPNALRRLTAEGSMTIAFIPIFVELREREGRAAAMAFARQVLGLVLASTLALCLGGMLFSRGLTMIFSPGFAADPEKFELTARFIRWTFPHLVLVSIVAWAMGVLNAEQRFAAPAAAPILFNLGIVAMIFLAADRMPEPALAIAVGAVLGGVAQVLLQVPNLVEKRAPLLPGFDWWTPPMRRFFALMGPALFGVAVYQINIIVLGILASYLPTGQVFHYNNATRLSEFVMGLFTFAFTTAGLPTLSLHHARRDWAAMGQTVRFTFAAVLYTTLPATVGLLAAGEPIVAMLYRHGAFTAADAASTARTLQYMALAMPAVALVRVLVPIFYATGNSRTPVLIAAGAVAVTAAGGWWLSGMMEVAGLALGLCLGTWFQALALAFALRGQTHAMGAWFPWRAAGQQAAACVAMGAAAAGMARFGDWSLGPLHAANWLVFLPLLAVSAALYGLLTLAQREEQALHWAQLFGKLGRRLGRLGRQATGQSAGRGDQ
jgi:putative peptidoglycan lipid II flippase